MAAADIAPRPISCTTPSGNRRPRHARWTIASIHSHSHHRIARSQKLLRYHIARDAGSAARLRPRLQHEASTACYRTVLRRSITQSNPASWPMSTDRMNKNEALCATLHTTPHANRNAFSAHRHRSKVMKGMLMLRRLVHLQ